MKSMFSKAVSGLVILSTVVWMPITHAATMVANDGKVSIVIKPNSDGSVSVKSCKGSGENITDCHNVGPHEKYALEGVEALAKNAKSDRNLAIILDLVAAGSGAAILYYGGVIILTLAATKLGVTVTTSGIVGKVLGILGAVGLTALVRKAIDKADPVLHHNIATAFAKDAMISDFPVQVSTDGYRLERVLSEALEKAPAPSALANSSR